MITREQTRQQLDPLGAAAARIPTIGLVAAAFTWAILETLSALPVKGVPSLLALALLLLAAACLLVIRASAPTRAPLGSGTNFAVHALLVVALLVWSIATWNSADFSQDAWAPLSLGLLTVALAPYRPVTELIGAGTLSAVLMSFITFVHAEAAFTEAPPLALAIVAAISVLALSFGSAAFSAGSIEASERARRRADVASEALAEELRDGIVRSVQQDRVTILGNDVAPFFAELLERGRITDSDRDRARLIASSIRGVMIADADRSWLETAMTQEVRPEWFAGTVEDPDWLAPKMNSGQRSALRALVVEVSTDPNVAGRFSVTLLQSDQRCHARLAVTTDSTDAALRARYGPCYAVMRGTFSPVTVISHAPDLIVQFSYDYS